MWKIKDGLTNFYLKIRLWVLVSLFKRKFDNITNDLDKSGWELTFNDEFDKGEIDKSKWRTDTYYGSRYHPGNIINNGEAPHSYFSEDTFIFEDSIMRQQVRKDPIEVEYIDWDGKNWGKYTIPYQIGQIDSSISFEQKFGYFEIKSRITSEPGSWPAFWLASKYSWPPEIDIYEIYTGKKKGEKIFESNFHWIKGKDNKSKMKKHRVLNVSEGFNTYAVEWNEKGFKIFYNNLLVRVYTNPKVINFFEFPMHIIINNGVDVDNKANESNYPTYHDVDYVRAYKKK